MRAPWGTCLSLKVIQTHGNSCSSQFHLFDWLSTNINYYIFNSNSTYSCISSDVRYPPSHDLCCQVDAHTPEIISEGRQIWYHLILQRGRQRTTISSHTITMQHYDIIIWVGQYWELNFNCDYCLKIHKLRLVVFLCLNAVINEGMPQLQWILIFVWENWLRIFSYTRELWLLYIAIHCDNIAYCHSEKYAIRLS